MPEARALRFEGRLADCSRYVGQPLIAQDSIPKQVEEETKGGMIYSGMPGKQ